MMFLHYLLSLNDFYFLKLFYFNPLSLSTKEKPFLKVGYLLNSITLFFALLGSVITSSEFIIYKY